MTAVTATDGEVHLHLPPAEAAALAEVLDAGAWAIKDGDTAELCGRVSNLLHDGLNLLQPRPGDYVQFKLRSQDVECWVPVHEGNRLTYLGSAWSADKRHYVAQHPNGAPALFCVTDYEMRKDPRP